MKKRYLVPIVLVSLTFVSATTYGVTRLIQNSIPQDDPRANPLVILSAKELAEPYQVGKFASGDDVITRTVKRNTTWGSYKTNMPTPTLSGFNLMGWQYSYTGLDNDYQAIDDGFVFDQNTYLRVSEWGAAEASSFATDSWATIVSEASNGLSSLKETYYDDLFKDHPEYNNSFVIQDYSNQQEVAAKTRIVNLKGVGDFRVRVIGEDQDIIADATNKVATLTFEFVDAVEPALGFSKGPNSDSWEDSYIKYYLDNSFIWRLPDPINRTDVLQTVVKKTLADDGSGGREIKESNEKLFLPSTSELGIRRINDGSVDSFSGYYQTPFDEGSAYEFYRLNAKNHESRIKYCTRPGKESLPVVYWTRSPFETEPASFGPFSKYSGKCVHVINEYGNSCSYLDGDGHVDDAYNVLANQSANAVAPCFCIGQDDAYNLNVTWDSGEDISVELRADSTISVDNTCKIQLYDKRDMTAPVYDIAEATTKPLFDIKSNGVDIPADYYNYNAGLGLLTINLPKDYELTHDVDVKILAKQQVNTDFETATWTNFLAEANKGFTNLTQSYNTEYIANGNTFVGLKRKITVDYSKELPGGLQVVYYVRVIGENHDTYGENINVPLTFVFTSNMAQLFSRDDGSIAVNVAFAGPYGNEEILKYTEGMSASHLRFFETIMSMIMPDELTGNDGMRSVHKTVTEMTDDGSYQNVNFEDKFFPLSYEEITGQDDMIPLSGEGERYSYFQLYGINACENCTTVDEGRGDVKVYPDCSFDHYWLRSLSKNKGQALSVNSFTGTIESFPATKSEGMSHLSVNVIPTFAVGSGE